MESDSKVEVIEKHYHGEQESKRVNGLDVAALTTAVATAAGVVIPAIKKAWNGDGSGATNGMLQFVPAAMNCLNAFAQGGTRSRSGDCDEISVLRSRIASLEAEKYSDNAAKDESNRLLVNYLKPYGDAIAANQVEVAALKAEINCGKRTSALEKENLELQINLAKQEADCCCKANAAAIDVVKTILGGITKTVIPSDAVCTARLG